MNLDSKFIENNSLLKLFFPFFFKPIDFKVKIFLPDFLNKFNDTIIDVPAEDMYYLLQTFASMALSREIADYEFINRVTIDIFKVIYY